ncbi:hypothetical protein HMSSN036_41060 [Paenibacillus macerans]|nr:hypothetical protein HMSSN036_41060 [Paenibacillus macerans]
MSLLIRNNGAILLLMINIFLVFTGIGLVVPIMPTYMNELHISGSIVGMLVAAFSLTQLVFSPFAGRLSDSLGRKKSSSPGCLFSPCRNGSSGPSAPRCCCLRRECWEASGRRS